MPPPSKKPSGYIPPRVRGNGRIIPGKFFSRPLPSGPEPIQDPKELFSGCPGPAYPSTRRFLRDGNAQQALFYAAGRIRAGQPVWRAGWAVQVAPCSSSSSSSSRGQDDDPEQQDDNNDDKEKDDEKKKKKKKKNNADETLGVLLLAGILEDRGPFGGGDHHVPTEGRAALRAAVAGLRGVPWAVEGYECVVVATDSAYVVDGATALFTGWWRDEWQGVPDQDLWELLMGEVERYHGLGVRVEFWEISPDANSVAGRLAAECIELTRKPYFEDVMVAEA
jgi:ribonuclease HI